MTDNPEPGDSGPAEADEPEEPRPIPSGRVEFEDRAGGPSDRETKDRG